MSIGDSMEQSWRDEEAAQPANADYTGIPCVQCGRIRVFLRRDGQYQCEKCETIQPAVPPLPLPLPEAP